MSNFRIIRDGNVDVARVTKSLILPNIRSSKLPPNLVSGIGGGLAYDIETRRVYYNNGSMWLALATSDSVSSKIISYDHIKTSSLSVSPNTNTTITLWTATPSPPHHTFSEWNLTTGVYTATEFQHLGIDADVSWSAGVSNLGQRILRVMYFDFNASSTIVANEVVTQADPNTNVETTQEISSYLKLNPGDMVWLEVRHNAPLTLSIAGGEHTSMSGTRILD